MLMSATAASSFPVGYCTNVHAGADLAQTQAQLARHAVAVRRHWQALRAERSAHDERTAHDERSAQEKARAADDRLGVGLWLSAAAAAKLRHGPELTEFAQWLQDEKLVPYTMNGFPYGDFHQERVQHQVYLPTWADPARRAYTWDLVEILDRLLPPGRPGTISTLPIAWGQPRPSSDVLRAAAQQLQQIATDLARLEADRGRRITLCLEPEPGCVLGESADVIPYFQDYLLRGGNEDHVRSSLQICHDVCHAAVMFEDQAEVISGYRAAGLQVGKVQVSAAVAVPFGQLEPALRPAALAQLAAFSEDRYLHQTLVKASADSAPVFYEHLPLALRTVPDVPRAAEQLTSEWRVHFHVPIYLAEFGLLRTTQPEIRAALPALRQHFPQAVYEVETYAWGVLPPALRQTELARGIATELAWFEQLL